MRRISLDEIAAATKIGTRSLKALEDENFSILPGGIFNKGFVRSYARFLGMDEDQAVADYQAAANEQPVSVKTIADQSAMAKASKLAAQQASESTNTAGLIRLVVIFVVVVAAAFGLYRAFRHGYFHALRRPSLHRQLTQQAQAPSPAPSATQPVASATPATTAASVPSTQPAPSPGPVADPPPTQPASTSAAEFTLSIKTSEPSWLSVTADGKPAFRRISGANEQQDVTAKSIIRIIIGNPNATELSLNGKPLVIEGNLHHPRTLVVAASGIQSE